MPRAKLPEFFRSYSTLCKGEGLTEKQAAYNYKLDAKYKLKWIKGQPVVDDPVHTIVDGKHVIQGFITFQDRRYLNEKEDG